MDLHDDNFKVCGECDSMGAVVIAVIYENDVVCVWRGKCPRCGNEKTYVTEWEDEEIFSDN